MSIVVEQRLLRQSCRRHRPDQCRDQCGDGAADRGPRPRRHPHRQDGLADLPDPDQPRASRSIRHFVTSSAGDATTGYPTISANLTSVYTLASGWAKGFRFGGTVLAGWKRNFYYYYTAPAGPGVPRSLLMQPTLFRVDPIFGYSVKFRHITWDTQLNITNVFNRYKVVLLPSPTAGWGGVNNAVFDQQPRQYQWTNTISF